jgi:hypothetical protein
MSKFVFLFVSTMILAFLCALFWQFGAFIWRAECHELGGELARTESSFGRWICAEVRPLEPK